MIESVDLVVAALAAGAAAGVTDTASTAVKDAYRGLKSLTRRALRRGGVAQEPTDPVELKAALTAADAGADVELVAAARRVLELADPAGAAKYHVDAHDNQGVQIGDGNTMTLNFGGE
ncbi:RIP homotypic interaction motif-containing protein [Saccharothrix sp. 6-C]|uniref:RIP homotypic interaction motif-containing protein n=1 Tax=Saccharothrix sp. 6-C TaxID=2781735 RepID=UPI001F475813|nr:RIP homotypic interaction motif-containing protein [Saccharothrix sp. 6-C]